MSSRARVAGVSVVLALATAPYVAQATAAPMTTDGGIGRPYAARCGPEDGAGWNWRRCGDHQRGVVTIGGRRLVVGPIRFDRLNRAFRIDWTRTLRLYGDGQRFDAQDY